MSTVAPVRINISAVQCEESAAVRIRIFDIYLKKPKAAYLLDSCRALCVLL